MPHRRITFFVAVLVALTGSCTATGDGVPSPSDATVPPSLLPATNDALPLMDVEAFQAMLGQLEGTPVVVNVWASWCEPCEQELPLLAAAAADHPRVQFIGVNNQDSREGAEAMIARYAIPYPSVFDPDGAIKTALDAFAPPVTVFYAADGTEVASIVGELSQETLDEGLAGISD